MSRCEEIFRQICWLEERSWPEVDGMGEEDEAAQLTSTSVGPMSVELGNSMANSMASNSMNSNSMASNSMNGNSMANSSRRNNSMTNNSMGNTGMNTPMMNRPGTNNGEGPSASQSRNSFTHPGVARLDGVGAES
jgi:hypothetical protein